MPGTFKSVVRGPLAPALVIAAALAATATAQLTGAGSDSGAEGNRAPVAGVPITLVHGTEVTGSDSVQDWAAAADYVVTARITAEEKLAAPKSETVDPADELIGRRVSVDVERVHWAAADAPQAAPSEFTMTAFGWRPTPAGDSELAGEHAARLEVGHTYLLALAWKRAECGEGERIPAAWTVIGPGGALPADEEVLGNGEFEGALVQQDSGRLAGGHEGKGSVLAKFAGKKSADVAREMEGTTAKRNHAFRELGGACS